MVSVCVVGDIGEAYLKRHRRADRSDCFSLANTRMH